MRITVRQKKKRLKIRILKLYGVMTVPVVNYICEIWINQPHRRETQLTSLAEIADMQIQLYIYNLDGRRKCMNLC
jgi:hypothetical protein